MARGWESKSIDSQMEEAASRRGVVRQPQLTAEEIRLRTQRESLELSRTRVLREIQEARHIRRREQLEAALRYLDQKLSALK